jgi:hypothetical protein
MPGVKLTYDDFVQFPDDGMRHELIEYSADSGDVLTTALLPGLEIPLTRVLRG